MKVARARADIAAEEASAKWRESVRAALERLQLSAGEAMTANDEV
jgi:hypothetical protein